MKFYVIAGEASGDMHGANLIKAIKEEEPEAEFRAWGGDRMRAEGADIVKHIRDLAFMGFAEVIMNLRTIKRNFGECKRDIKSYKPDAVILIDYPGFNLRMAKFIKNQGIKVLYYISPQIWAWKKNRIYDIKKYVDGMFVILPFEKAFYAKYDVDVEYVGHPLLDEIERYRATNPSAIQSERPILAVLPGSRKQEIEKKLPIMLEMSAHFHSHELIVAKAPSVPDEVYSKIISGRDVRTVEGSTYALLDNAHTAMVTSGTATLETALFGVPEVVCYKGSPISYHIAKRIIDIKYISLVNLIMDREVVKELIQAEFNPAFLKTELDKILNEGNQRSKMVRDLALLRSELGGPGASKKAAVRMLKTLRG